jgi:hypothetical protein
MLEEPTEQGGTKLVCLRCDDIDPMKTDAIKWANSSFGIRPLRTLAQLRVDTGFRRCNWPNRLLRHNTHPAKFNLCVSGEVVFLFQSLVPARTRATACCIARPTAPRRLAGTACISPSAPEHGSQLQAVHALARPTERTPEGR